MMRRAFSLLLIPCVLASQGWLCAFHTHCDHVAVSSDHAIRPHFHTGEDAHDHHHRDHSHSSTPLTHALHNEPDAENHASDGSVIPLHDHDADAVYCPDTVTLGLARSVIVSTIGEFPTPSFCAADGIVQNGADFPLMRSGYPPPFLDARCPLFLRNLCIRC
ncbi:MAG: hypothetical protein ACKVT0_01360 [Planctomycetaceae bacterium]